MQNPEVSPTPEQNGGNGTPQQSPEGVLSRLGYQTKMLGAGAALMASAILSGCGTEQKQTVAKFSSLGDNAQVDLKNVEDIYKTHSSVQSSVAGLEGAVRELASDVSNGGSQSASLSTAKLQAKALADALDRADDSASFAPPAANINNLKKVITTLENASGSLSGDQVKEMQNTLSEWGTALKRDVQMLERGVSAARVAKLEVVLRRSVSALDDAVAKIGSNPESYDATSENHKSIVTALKDGKSGLEIAAKTAYFRSISSDLTNAATLVGDAIKTLDGGDNVKKYWKREMGKTDSDGSAVCKAAKDLINAIAADNQQELTKAMGVQAPTTGSQGGTQHVYHHNSGLDFGDLMLYHMIFNSGPSYTYYPGSYSYSSPDRMYRSSGYSNYDKSYNAYRTTVSGSRNSGSLRSTSSMSTTTRGSTYRASSSSSSRGSSGSYGRSASGRNSSSSSSRSSSGGGFGRSGGGRSGGG